MYNSNKNEEKHCSFGSDYPDIFFYVIGVDYSYAGLGAIVKSVLSHLIYAEQKGMIPVVDMLHYKSPLGDGISNVWERLFKQPYGYSLNDIMTAKHVVLSRNCNGVNTDYAIDERMLDSIELQVELSVFFRRLIIPADWFSDYLKRMEGIIGSPERCLGVLCRGTDYLYRRPSRHPIQPHPTVVMEKVKRIAETEDVETVFLATEDEEVLDQFQREFGASLKFVDQPRFGRKQDSARFLCDCFHSLEELIQTNIQYYSSLHLLSRCGRVVGGRTCGSIIVSLMSPDKNRYWWKLGAYE